jgi:hypothetical protein
MYNNKNYFSLSTLQHRAFEATTRFIRQQKDSLRTHNPTSERRMMQSEIDNELRNINENQQMTQSEDNNGEKVIVAEYPMVYRDFARSRVNRFFGPINDFVKENTPRDAQTPTDDFDASRLCHTQ